MEKAHPDVFDILLQVLDDGRLTDGQGRTVDFRNTILVLTSNLGSHVIADPALSEQAKRDAVMGIVQAAFKPEFLNRLDDIVVFDSLSTEELTQIVDLQVARLARRLADRRLTLEVTPAREWLAVTGFDPVYGARPLRRLIQSAIGDQLARALLAGDIRDGDQVVVDLDPRPNKLTSAAVTPAPRAPARPKKRAPPGAEQSGPPPLGEGKVDAEAGAPRGPGAPAPSGRERGGSGPGPAGPRGPRAAVPPPGAPTPRGAGAAPHPGGPPRGGRGSPEGETKGSRRGSPKGGPGGGPALPPPSSASASVTVPSGTARAPAAPEDR